MQMTVYDPDSTAIALVLGDEGEMYIQRGANRVWLENGVALKEEPYMTTLKDYQI
jgi:hypothetical protein